jgi:hypothetical protein
MESPYMKTVLWICMFILLGAIPAFAQGPFQIEVSAYGGVPLNSTLTQAFCCTTATGFVAYQPENAHYVVGLSSGVVISDRLHVTFGATYLPVSFIRIGFTPTATLNEPAHGTSWDFPLLADYRWLKGSVRPYSGGGLVVLSRVTEGPNQALAPVITGGVEWVHRTFAIRPEFRYIHFPDGSGSDVHVQRPQNQYQVLVGFAFRTNSKP